MGCSDYGMFNPPMIVIAIKGLRVFIWWYLRHIRGKLGGFGEGVSCFLKLLALLQLSPGSSSSYPCLRGEKCCRVELTAKVLEVKVETGQWHKKLYLYISMYIYIYTYIPDIHTCVYIYTCRHQFSPQSCSSSNLLESAITLWRPS